MPRCAECGRENADDARFCSGCGTRLAAEPPRREVRKTVTVLFADVTGSTGLGERLDPESLRRVMERYFDAMRSALEHHGGTVEKFIGDAVMALFGLPRVHEDDALRAVRAAAEMRERLARLNDELERDYGVTLEIRTGVNTGEVVAGDGRTLATGDAVNVAARLEQAAAPGEILLGETTYRLVRDAVEVEVVEPVVAKGKTDRVAAVRLERVVADADAFARRFESPLVGRVRELRLLEDAYRRAAEERACHLFTILGPAGIGKSRLTQELCARVGREATVVTGRCLPYGEGITYWPLVEILRQLGSDAALELLEGEPDAREIVNGVVTGIGLAEGPGSREETFWAVRKLFEVLARERPLVAVLDDLHWAESTLLDLVEYVADWNRDSPILLLCLARPELLDERPGWGGGKLNATSILIEPLSEADSAALMDELLAGAPIAAETHARIAHAAEGNPLFVEQMLAMLVEEPSSDGDVVVPPTIHALLSARLDRLQPDERAVVERASVVGKEFWRRAITDLAPDVTNVERPLQALVRKELIRPHRSMVFPGDDAFRFRHILVRDAAYTAMPKELRAELHERFADWLEQNRSEYDEIVGYHLEQAFRYREQLGPIDERARSVARRAAEHLATAGRRAADRGDVAASVNLISRAVELLPASSGLRLELLPDLGYALFETGDLERADETFRSAVAAGQESGARAVEARARVGLLTVDLMGGGRMEEALASAERELEALDREDDVALAEILQFVGKLRGWLGDTAAADAAYERALEHARRAASTRLETDILSWQLIMGAAGHVPVAEGLERVEEVLARGPSRPLEAWALATRSIYEALAGHFEEARADYARVIEILRELGMNLHAAAGSMFVAQVELVAGDSAAAAERLRAGYDELEAMGEKGYLSSVAGFLAEALYRQGRYDDAARYSEASETAAAPDDVESQMLWRLVRGKVFARRGDVGGGDALVREAVELGRRTDFLDVRALTLLGLVETLRLAGRDDEAAPLVTEALELSRRKGNVVFERQLEELLAELAAEPLAEGA